MTYATTRRIEPIRYRILKPESGYMEPKTFGRAYVSGNFVLVHQKFQLITEMRAN